MIIICLVVIFDLFKFGIHHNPTISPKVWLSKPKTVQFLESEGWCESKKDKGFYRIYNFGTDSSWWMIYLLSKGWIGNLNLYVNHREVLQPSFNMVFHIPSEGGCPEFMPKRFEEIFCFLYNKDNVKSYARKQGDLRDIVGFALPKPQITKLLGILNVKYILTFWEIESSALKEIFKIDFKKDMLPTRIYENKEVLPRVYVVPKAKIVKDEEKILDELTNSEFNPMEYVVLEEEVDFSSSESVKGSNVKIIKYSPL